MQVNMHEAKTQLSALGKKVWEGEKVIIAKAGKPYLILSPYKETQEKRKPGGYERQIVISEDFDQTPEELIAAFEGSE